MFEVFGKIQQRKCAWIIKEKWERIKKENDCVVGKNRYLPGKLEVGGDVAVEYLLVWAQELLSPSLSLGSSED